MSRRCAAKSDTGLEFTATTETAVEKVFLGVKFCSDFLGKTNLGEWANFRGFDNVYPARGRLERAGWRHQKRL
jgi:hypothetical protein